MPFPPGFSETRVLLLPESCLSGAISGCYLFLSLFLFVPWSVRCSVERNLSAPRGATADTSTELGCDGCRVCPFDPPGRGSGLRFLRCRGHAVTMAHRSGALPLPERFSCRTVLTALCQLGWGLRIRRTCRLADQPLRIKKRGWPAIRKSLFLLCRAGKRPKNMKRDARRKVHCVCTDRSCVPLDSM